MSHEPAYFSKIRFFNNPIAQGHAKRCSKALTKTIINSTLNLVKNVTWQVNVRSNFKSTVFKFCGRLQTLNSSGPKISINTPKEPKEPGKEPVCFSCLQGVS